MIKNDYYFIQHKNGRAGLATGKQSTEAVKQAVFSGLQKHLQVISACFRSPIIHRVIAVHQSVLTNNEPF